MNFCLIYLLDPNLAAAMPAQWAPIPLNVVAAIVNSTNGWVPYADVSQFLITA